MIKIDLNWAISIYLSLALLLVFLLWIFYTYKRSESLGLIEYLQQCPLCTHIFYSYKTTPIQQCPQCKSYIDINPENRLKEYDKKSKTK